MSAASSRKVEIVNKRGLHARASHRFVQTAEQFDASVTVEKDGMAVGGDEIMELLLLAASKGCFIEISAKGAEADKALDALEALIGDKFGEAE